ncbi:plantaricin C family lantibiotic [Bacillus cereus]|uniref:Plantaricin C family lantibiotic n=1 Tax=Bacillus cereus TaxID=1396 RepID=A0A9X8IVI3_BACCE|nr:plantaricin C family lantibiotic [Bacillus cereus]RWQ71006.1 plantaricin C family lantibiotic [Bacillus cereus]
MKELLKNPVLQNKYSMKEKNPAGDLLQEVNEQEMQEVNGGVLGPAESRAIARKMGLGNNYGSMCTVSAECMFTISCGS